MVDRPPYNLSQDEIDTLCQAITDGIDEIFKHHEIKDRIFVSWEPLDLKFAIRIEYAENHKIN